MNEKDKKATRRIETVESFRYREEGLQKKKKGSVKEETRTILASTGKPKRTR